MIDRPDPHEAAAELAAGSRSRAALIRRFRRIEGQARGLQKMVETDRDPADVLMQIASVREALHSAAALILGEYLATNAQAILLSESAEDTSRLLDRAVEVFRKWAT